MSDTDFLFTLLPHLIDKLCLVDLYNLSMVNKQLRLMLLMEYLGCNRVLRLFRESVETSPIIMQQCDYDTCKEDGKREVWLLGKLVSQSWWKAGRMIRVEYYIKYYKPLQVWGEKNIRCGRPIYPTRIPTAKLVSLPNILLPVDMCNGETSWSEFEKRFGKQPLMVRELMSQKDWCVLSHCNGVCGSQSRVWIVVVRSDLESNGWRKTCETPIARLLIRKNRSILPIGSVIVLHTFHDPDVCSGRLVWLCMPRVDIDWQVDEGYIEPLLSVHTHSFIIERKVWHINFLVHPDHVIPLIQQEEAQLNTCYGTIKWTPDISIVWVVRSEDVNITNTPTFILGFNSWKRHTFIGKRLYPSEEIASNATWCIRKVFNRYATQRRCFLPMFQ